MTAQNSTDSNTPNSLIEQLTDAQVAFIKHWLVGNSNSFINDLLVWFGKQPLDKFISTKDLQSILNDWFLQHPANEDMRQDIKDLLQHLLTNPKNTTTTLQQLIDEDTVVKTAHYIATKKHQRDILISLLVNNTTFANILANIIYHAIEEFTNTTLEKAGGVGKLMQFGRNQFERATNHHFNAKLQDYLQKNTPYLIKRSHDVIKQHLTNTVIEKAILNLWQNHKHRSVNELLQYLPDNLSHYLEDGLFKSYEYLRNSELMVGILNNLISQWMQKHQHQSISTLAKLSHIDYDSSDWLSKILSPLFEEWLNGEWCHQKIYHLVSDFYQQDTIKKLLQ